MADRQETEHGSAVTGEAEGARWLIDHSSDDQLQAHLLDGVSRTFALTIPQLPPELARAVSNQYLLCRIVDTIEDEPALSFAQKRYFCELFARVVAGTACAEQFAGELAPLLSDSTIPAEHDLIRYTPDVIRITSSFSEVQRRALHHCITVMSDGMVEFQRPHGDQGLDNLPHMDRYCYFVAGIVGETLTELFCEYSPEIAKRKDAMMRLAVSFGQGLQMTNILKDIWDDQGRGACWLPRDVFGAKGFDLNKLPNRQYHEGFGRALCELIAVAQGHLHDAVEYTLLIPRHETGIRNFCLWAIGMAVLTLRKIHGHVDFSSGNEVKITRRSVKATIIASRVSAAHDWLVRALFRLASIGLPPRQRVDLDALRN